MANLRTNNLSGEQGQYAYRGSVYFDGEDNSNLAITSNSDFTFGTGVFTAECWILIGNYPPSNVYGIFDTGTSVNANRFSMHVYPNGKVYIDNNTNLIISDTILSTYSWHHLAFVREGTGSNESKLYINGVLDKSATISSDFTNDDILIGKTIDNYEFKGYISNARITKGEAVYTANFTPSLSELTADANTVLLCCQDSDDPTQEETGKTITASGNLAETDLVKQQPKVIPPYGVDAGNTFGGPIQQSTQGYMYFPTGRTEERGRGRAVSWLGNNDSSGSYTKQIDFFDIQSTGTTTKFGEISDTVGLGAAMSSTTRGVFAGGTKPAVGNMNLLEFITIATTGNAVDFGGISTLFRYGGGISNSTRGLIVGAYQGGGASGTLNTIQFITIASLGNSADFGDIVANSGDGIFGAGTCSSSTRGITFGGGTPSSINEINSITIGTLGNSVDFGDLSAAKQLCQGVSSSTRGVVAGGDNSGAVNVIELITIASAGNATDFGDLPSISEYAGSSGGSNKIRGVFTGRGDYPAFDNSMQFITIATTGDAQDFGDVSTGGGDPYGSSNVSDSHGGL